MNLLSAGPQSELNKHQTMAKAAFMKNLLLLWLICLSVAPAAANAADSFLVENGDRSPETEPSHPLLRGFDYFYGYRAHRDAHFHYPQIGNRLLFVILIYSRQFYNRVSTREPSS